MVSLPLHKRKEAGSPINKPRRAAYLNSSLGTHLNKKCDGSHIHTPCSGQNTSITEGYTPKIVRIVHECFRDDVRSGKFDVPTYASAAVHKHVDRFDVPTYDLGSVPKYIQNVNLIAALSRPKPPLSIGAKHQANLPNGKLDRNIRRDG